MTYTFDTNIVSYFIQSDMGIAKKIREVIAANNSIVISPVTYFEIRRGFKLKAAPKKEQGFSRMCTVYPIGEMSLPVWEQAADIYAACRKSGVTIGDSDILIGAFSIVNGYTLVTNNARHFISISGLKFIVWNPQEL